MKTNTANRAAANASSGFGPMLREWRHARGTSQLDLSLTCGVSQRHLSFLESGRSRPSRDTVLHLASALNVPLQPGTADGSWLECVDRVLTAAVLGFRPDLIVSQHGCDIHRDDPLATLECTTRAARGAADRAESKNTQSAASSSSVLK